MTPDKSAVEALVARANEPLPWGINRLRNMVAGPGITTHAIMPTERGTMRGREVRAVPEPYHTMGFERLRAAWWVLTGRAHAIVWPEPGELEAAMEDTP
jgi:hypothetical protein